MLHRGRQLKAVAYSKAVYQRIEVIMSKSSDEILDSVIEALRAERRDLSRVKLEEAKQLTLRMLKQRQAEMQASTR